MAISSSTLTKELLAQLGRGITSTRLLPVADGSVTVSTLNFTNAGLIYSIEDSFAIDWGEPTLNNIRVDQGQQVIAVDTEQGDITFSANYPTIAEAALSEFFKVGKASVVTTDTNVTFTGKSYFTDPRTVECSLLVEDADSEFVIIFARVSITARLAYDNDTKIWYIALSGRVLANLADGEGDIIVAPKTA